MNLADNGAASSQQPFATQYGIAGGPMVPGAGQPLAKRARKMSGMTWMFLGLLIFFIAAAAFTAVVTPIRRAVGPAGPAVSAPAPPRAYFGVNSFEDGDGGVTFENVDVPGGPADKAGLFGGDIITRFDGQIVHNEDEMTDLVRRTPIGKAVEVIYLRDGESKTTTLTTVSREEVERLENEFENRPEGMGLFGFNDGEIERVSIPGTKIFGVRLDGINPNRPADLAGIKKGDVIIEFDRALIRTTEEFKSRVNRAIPYSTVKVVLMRGADRLEMDVKVGKK